jgi:hypothetical protein
VNPTPVNRPLFPDIPASLKKHDLLVLAWNRHFFGEDFLRPVAVPNPGGKDILLTFTTDRKRIAQADAIWFHGPTISDLPDKNSGQPWIMMSMESDANYPKTSAPIVDRIFDITATYRLDSDVPCVYTSWREYGSFTGPPIKHFKAQSPAVYIASHAVQQRDQFVAELMRHIPIDCLGTRLRNHRIKGFASGVERSGNGGLSMPDVLKYYRYYIAFENSIATDYVTEKIYHALSCGIVPVYHGAPNIRQFLPHDDAAILASDFSSPAELADYMNHLTLDSQAYARHLAWRQRPLSESFTNLVNLGNVDSRYRLAVKLAHGCDKECHCGGRLR